ncbi:MAG: PEP-CTERM sorting domain-containing protein [Verrucomicrobiota bacterium]
MKTLLKCLIAASIALSGHARASFHLFDIQEVFSNSDGSVLFIELFSSTGGQQFLSGHSLTFQINTAIQNTINFTNLPGDTTSKTFLVGTANLGTLYGVTPDYVIPANFFTAGANNFLNFAEGTDRVNLTSLPVNGSSSLNGLIGNAGQTSAATSVNTQATPTNFAGQTAVIPEPGGTALICLTAGLAGFRRRRPATMKMDL